jgi:hypothetical protein
MIPIFEKPSQALSERVVLLIAGIGATVALFGDVPSFFPTDLIVVDVYQCFSKEEDEREGPDG